MVLYISHTHNFEPNIILIQQKSAALTHKFFR